MKDDRTTTGSDRSPERPTFARSIVGPVLVAFAAVIVLMGIYELAERTWLAGADAESIQTLNRIRGASAALIAALLVSWLILLRTPPLLERSTSRTQTLPRGPQERRLHYARWFVRMRWVAVVVASLLAFAAVEVFALLPVAAGRPLAATIAALALLNLVFSLHLRRRSVSVGFLALQAHSDLAILITLLHFSGGLENPLTPLTLLHVIIAAIVLDRRHTYLVAATAAVLFAIVAWGEWSGLLAHYPLAVVPHTEVAAAHAPHDSLYVAIRVGFQVAMLLLVAYFTTTITDRLRRDERKLESLASRAVAQAEQLERALAEQKAAEAGRVQAERLAALGQLAGQVAHEVNNPIAILTAKARLLLGEDRESLPPRARAEITKIVALADRVGHIASALLAFCRPTRGAARPLDIRVPIRTVLREIAERASLAGVVVRDELPDQLPLVLANEREVEHVFLNVCHNSVDAMPSGGTLRIAATQSGQTNGPEDSFVEVIVEDTGIGIPGPLQDRIFEPFVTTKSDGRAAGLGLSIALGLVKGQGGGIRVESEPGQHTRILVRLPAAAVEKPGDATFRTEVQAYV